MESDQTKKDSFEVLQLTPTQQQDSEDVLSPEEEQELAWLMQQNQKFQSSSVEPF